ncbi:MAG: DUF4339 domain-containing protein [Planctomycetes bacterium]|nr:DUF4339 domain-containing protein [Planctomycetota bacterium]
MQWFIVIGRERHGPYPEMKVKSMLVRGEIHEGTLVWRDGMKDWQPISERKEFSDVEPASISTHSNRIAPEKS